VNLRDTVQQTLRHAVHSAPRWQPKRTLWQRIKAWLRRV
jgi:hypothetical protein